MSTDPLDNDGRAGFAATALAAYYDETRNTGDTYGDEGSEEFNDALSDLLGDLQHLARRAGLNFGELMERGTGHFEEELREEMALAEEERIRMGAAPVDEKVLAALDEGYQTFSNIRDRSGVDRTTLRFSLLRLLDQEKAEQYPGYGWRRVTAPLEERVLDILATGERWALSSIEVDYQIEENRLRACLKKLVEDGRVKMDRAGYRLVASNG